MKTGTKTVRLLLALMMILVVILTGCTKSTKDEATSTAAKTASNAPTTSQATDEPDIDSALPIVDEPLTLTYWVPFRKSNAQIMTSFAEADAWKELMARTGITLELIHPALDQQKAEYQLMIASNDLPDIIEMTYMGSAMYPGGNDAAIEDGVYTRLNELIDEYAPNFLAVMKSDPDIEKSLKTDTGNIWAFQMIELEVQPAFAGPALRGDWLETLEMDVPETIDDWYVVLSAFRDEMGATSPLLLAAEGIFEDHSWIGAYGVINDFYQVDGTVMYGPIEEGYKEYLMTMNKWYDEGLIDQNFVSYDGMDGTDTMNKLATGEAGAVHTGFWLIETYAETSDDENMLMLPAPYPSLEEGQTVVFRQYNEKVRKQATVITSACEHQVEAVKMLDYNYSEEGFYLMNYGIEGLSYNIVDGQAVFTDYVLDNPDYPTFSYDDMLTIAARHSGPFVRDVINLCYVAHSAFSVDCMNVTWKGDDSGMLPGSLNLTTEEGTEFNTTMSDIETYVAEMVPKFIMGLESFDDYDAFLQTITDMGIEDMITIEQAALDRYNDR